MKREGDLLLILVRGLVRRRGRLGSPGNRDDVSVDEENLEDCRHHGLGQRD